MAFGLKSHIDDGVSLNVVHVRVPDAELLAVSLCRAHDACSHSVLQSERAADGHHELSWAQVSWVAQRKNWKLFLIQKKRYTKQHVLYMVVHGWPGPRHCIYSNITANVSNHLLYLSYVLAILAKMRHDFSTSKESSWTSNHFIYQSVY